VFDLAGSYPINMHVTGVLAARHARIDGAVFTDYKTEWIILGIMHGHQARNDDGYELLTGRDAGNVTATAQRCCVSGNSRTLTSFFPCTWRGVNVSVSGIIHRPA